MQGKAVLKKGLTISLALCLLLSCLIPAFAMGDYYDPIPNSGSCGPCATYNIEDGVLTISGTGPVTNIPAVDDYRHFRDPLHTVIVEEGITVLPSDTSLCFMPNITHVELPDSLLYVGRMAFVNTAWLDSLTDEFYIVGDGILLDYNGSGGKVVVPDTVRYISSQAFSGTDVTDLVLGSSVKYIGDGTWGLEDTSKLKTVTFDGKTYDTSAYSQIIYNNYNPWIKVKRGVDAYTGADVFNSFLVMDGVLLYYGGGSGAVTVPDAVTTIANGGIYGSPDKFTKIIIPDTVTEIAEHAIQGGSLDGNKPTFVCAAADSAAQKFVENNTEWLFRFMANGQDNSSLLNFTIKETYYSSMFKDVHAGDWFQKSVASAFELGLMNGRDKDVYGFYTFVPNGNIQLSEAITVAARMRDTYYYEETDFTAAEGAMWYQPYVDYALTNKIIAEVPKDLDRPATRAEFASMLAAALPSRELEVINGNIAFVDLDETHPTYDDIMVLVKAGVMEGKGDGVFDPDAQVKRCEAAAMLTRCVRPEQRVHLG